MRILFSGTPAFGHLLPLLPLERAARAAGHRTAVLTHPSMADALAPTAVVPAGPTLEAVMTEVHRRTGADAATDMSPGTAGEFFGGARVDLGAEEALAAAEAFAPDLVVAESADFLGPLVAARLGVPWVSHAVGIAIEAPLAEAMKAAAVRRMRDRGIEPTEPVASVDPWPACLQRDNWEPSADRIALRSSAHEEESEPAAWTRPEFPGRDHLPRVLVTLGTIVDEPDTLAAIVASLAGQEVNAIVAVNPASGTDSLVVDASRAHVVGFVPMSLLLDGVDVVVSSGGAGTVLASLSSGIPMVVLPKGLDKPLNAERATATGAALTVTGPGEVGAAVARVLAESSFFAAATTTSELIAGARTPEDVLTLLLERASTTTTTATASAPAPTPAH
ncbi:glycosyltransferase [Streptomyces sp. NPDC090106]|uniref:glycosyltransferase n=1 Tax=Streptomyces sp. NPDC090106 TaxID=3365946 RepID=UPI00380506F1